MTDRSTLLAALLVFAGASARAEDLPDIRSVPPDLAPPAVTGGEPAPGKRVRQALPDYAATEVHHVLYLPADWAQGKRYPVIVEYAGNGPYKNAFGDVCTGRVEDGSLGYGISGGRGFLWVCLPYVSADRQRNQLQWWGDVEATVAYCKDAVPRICRDYGGDPSAVLLAGFSRGSIACNYIGLHDNGIAALWRGFICHSHYDGVRTWGYAGDDRAAATERLKRLKDRPQFVSHEGSAAETRRYLAAALPSGRFTFLDLPFRNHTDGWVLRDIPERKALRAWVEGVLGKKGTTDEHR
jgi:hypothetical protein